MSPPSEQPERMPRVAPESADVANAPRQPPIAAAPIPPGSEQPEPMYRAAPQSGEVGTTAMMARRLAALRGPPMTVVKSADGASTWRLGPRGTIERFDVESRTWRKQTTGVGADLVAGSAPAANVCWAVGKGGVVLQTIDGEHWAVLDSPTPSDLTGVSADDASSATVVAADGHRYATTDGGKTWQPE
jgi:photosystem II stability/assembly factor-like uncharacterized protein